MEKMFLHSASFSATISLNQSRNGRHPLPAEFYRHFCAEGSENCHTSLGSELTGTRRNKYKNLRIRPDVLFYTALRQNRGSAAQPSCNACGCDSVSRDPAKEEKHEKILRTDRKVFWTGNYPVLHRRHDLSARLHLGAGQAGWLLPAEHDAGHHYVRHGNHHGAERF